MADSNRNTKLTAAQRQERLARDERKREYDAAKLDARKIFLIVFGATALVALVALLVTLLTNVVYINNKSMAKTSENAATWPMEVWVGGSRFLEALFSGNWTGKIGPDGTVLGSDNLPAYYYWAKDLCNTAGILTLLSVIALGLTLLVSVIAAVFAFVKKEYVFSYFSLACSVLSFVLLLVLYIVAAQIFDVMFVKYCGENPACTMGSDVLWPFLLSVLMLGGNIFSVVMFAKLEKKRKAIRSAR